MKNQCYRCDKEFSSEQRRDYHCRNNVCNPDLPPEYHGQYGGKVFECRFCRKKFTSNQRLQYHQDNLVCVKQNRRCKFCDKTLSSLRNFRQHQCKIKKEEIEKFREYNPQITLSTMELLLEERKELRWMRKDFDAEEPWYHQKYWNSTCDRCGCIRKQVGHYVTCRPPSLRAEGEERTTLLKI